MNNFIEQIVDYINRYIEHETTYSEKEYIFGVRDKALNHIFMIIRYTIWLLKNLGKPLNINIFRFQLFKRINADECYKSKRIFCFEIENIFISVQQFEKKIIQITIYCYRMYFYHI